MKSNDSQCSQSSPLGRQDETGLDATDSVYRWHLTTDFNLRELTHDIDKLRYGKRFIGSGREQLRSNLFSRLKFAIINTAQFRRLTITLSDSGWRGVHVAQF